MILTRKILIPKMRPASPIMTRYGCTKETTMNCEKHTPKGHLLKDHEFFPKIWFSFESNLFESTIPFNVLHSSINYEVLFEKSLHCFTS